MSNPTRIDVHQHIVPPDYANWLTENGIKPGGGSVPNWSVEDALNMMDEHGIATGILSVSSPGVHLGNDAQARVLAREVNIAQAALHAVQQRLRPILMTTIAALVGFLPLLLASGAGSASRLSLGTAVFGGLLVSTLMSLLLVPVLYVVVKNITEFASKGRPPQPPLEPQPTQLAAFNGNSHVQSGTVLKSQGNTL